MAVTVWLVRQTALNGGRLGAVRVADDVASDLVKKGDALPFDRNLRAALRALKAGPGAEPAPDPDTPPPKRKPGRPPKAKEADQLALADPEPEPDSGD